MLVHVFRFNWRDKLVLSAYSSIYIKSIFISHVYLSLFVLIFQVHCMWTEYIYIDLIFGTIRLYVVNAMKSRSRMHFVKGLVAIKGFVCPEHKARRAGTCTYDLCTDKFLQA